MPTLRKRLIRLAHDKPDLRPHLIPILSKRAAIPSLAPFVSFIQKIVQRMGPRNWKVSIVPGTDSLKVQLFHSGYGDRDPDAELDAAKAIEKRLQRKKDVASTRIVNRRKYWSIEVQVDPTPARVAHRYLNR